jgi:hypothetical protein
MYIMHMTSKFVMSFIYVAVDNICQFLKLFSYLFQSYLNSIERYDPQTNQWSSDVAPTSSCRTSVGVAVLEGYLYAVGGQVQRKFSLFFCWARSLNQRTHTWTPPPPQMETIALFVFFKQKWHKSIIIHYSLKICKLQKQVTNYNFISFARSTTEQMPALV